MDEETQHHQPPTKINMPPQQQMSAPNTSQPKRQLGKAPIQQENPQQPKEQRTDVMDEPMQDNEETTAESQLSELYVSDDGGFQH